MVRLYSFVLVLVLAQAAVLGAQSTSTNPGGPPRQSSTNQSAAQADTKATAGTGVLRVLSPTVGENLKSSMVMVRYELASPGAAAASPTYRIQLDQQDPIETLSSSYTFTGIAPGEHLLSVELVDANHTPLPGSRVEVRFRTSNPPQNASPTAQVIQSPGVQKASLALPGLEDKELPDAGGAMPLLSIVGFGVLVGGIASALRTRR